MSICINPGDASPAGVLFQLHQLKMLVEYTDSDWGEHVQSWLSGLFHAIDRGLTGGTLEASRVELCMGVSGKPAVVHEWKEFKPSTWALILGAAWFLDDPEDGLMSKALDRDAYRCFVNWAFAQIAQDDGIGILDGWLTGQSFREELNEFSAEWGIPVKYAIFTERKPND
jgi:hypothetical protein